MYEHTLPPCENGIAYIRRYVSGQKYTGKQYREMYWKAVLRNVSSAKQLPQPRPCAHAGCAGVQARLVPKMALAFLLDTVCIYSTYLTGICIPYIAHDHTLGVQVCRLTSCHQSDGMNSASPGYSHPVSYLRYSDLRTPE